jgi:hypothetical protein
MMSTFYVTAPGADRPMRERDAYQTAFACWCIEKAAHAELDALCVSPVTAAWPDIKAAQIEVARAEDALEEAVVAYVDAIRNTEYPVRRVAVAS